MTGGRMTGGRMTGGRMTGGRMTGGRMTGGRMTGGRMTGGRMTGGRMTERELVALLPARPGLLVLDFDGVLTDNFVWTDGTGQESVRCSKEDSLGLALLRQAGFPVVILSSETHEVVRRRAAKLRIDCYAGVADKLAVWGQLLERYQVRADQVIYVGNDVNDLDCLRRAGCGLVVADAHPRVQAVARGVLSRPGGQGAVREVCEALQALWTAQKARQAQEAA